MATDWKASLPKKRISKRFKFSGGSQSLGNTGAGENGVVEPSKPTAMFQTALGPRMVHEGEDLNRLPNGDIQVKPVTQSALAQMEKQQKIPGMRKGGLLENPTSAGSMISGIVNQPPPTGASPAPASGEIGSAGQVIGGISDRTMTPIAGSTPSPSPTLNIGAPITTTPTQQTVNPLLPGQSSANVGLDVGSPVATSGPSGGFQHFQPAGAEGGPPVPPTTETPTPTGLTGLGDQAVAKGLGGLEAIAAGESPVDRTIANRTLGNLSAQQEAERMAAIQNQAQQGVSGPAAQAQQAMLGISQGSQMGQTAGQLAIGAQERAAGAVRDLLTGGQAQQRFEFEKQKYGDEEFTRMATDISNGMTFEQAKQKYPNLSREDYESTRGTVLFEQDRARLDAARDDVGTWVDQMVTSDPEWMSSGKWMTDPQMQARLSNLWKEEGMEGEYNPNNAAHQAWAQTQIAPYTVTPEEAEINRVRNSPWYQGLEPDEQNEVDDLLDFATTISVTQGYTLGENPDGSTYITNADGDVVYGSRTNDPDAPPGLSSEDVNGFIDAMADNGVTVSTSRARQYMNEHPGEGYPTPEDFQAWDSSTADIGNILDFFSGEPTTLSTPDRDYINTVREAQKAVADGTATDEQRRIATSIPYTIGDFGFSMGTKTSGADRKNYKHGPYDHAGTFRVSMEYNNDVYDIGSHKDSLTFEDDFRTWANENAGNIVEIDGVMYRIASGNPIVDTTLETDWVSGDDPYTWNYDVEALQVVNLETGETEKLTFGAKGIVDD